MRKSAIAVIVVLALIIGSVALSQIAEGGPMAPLLALKVAFSRDTVLGEISCGNGYSWRVVNVHTFFPGNEIEVGTPAAIHTERKLELLSQKGIIGKSRNGYGFDQGEAFTDAYIFFPQAVLPTWGIGNATNVSATAVSQKDFQATVECLIKDRKEFESLLSEDSSSTPIGWILRIDDVVKRDSLEHAADFVCSGGQHANILSGIVGYMKNGPISAEIVGVTGLDGIIYKLRGGSVDLSQPAELPDMTCKNSEGVTLQDFIRGLPGRIHFVQ